MCEWAFTSASGTGMALERGPVLLIGSGLLRVRHAVLPERHPVGVALELPAEQERMKRHLVSGDLADAELLEQLPSGFTVLFAEEVDRRAVSERRLVHAVDVRHDEADPVLVERVEARSLHEHAADVLVDSLDVGLLRRAVRVGVPETDAARQELRRIVLGIGTVAFDHHGVGELDAVVPQGREEQRAEEFGSRDFPEHVEDARAGLCRLCVAEECKRQPRVGEDHREEDLSADRSDDGVDLAGHDPRILLEPFAQLLDGPSDAALRVGLDLHFLAFRLASAEERQVMPLREEQTPVDPVVDGARLHALEEFGVARDDVAHGLALLDAEGDDRVHISERLVVDADAETARVQDSGVVGLHSRGAVVLLAERAAGFAFASVADVGRLRPARATGLEETRAAIEAARGVLADAAREPVEKLQLALLEAAAEPVGASVALFAVDPAALDLARDRRVGSPEVFRDFGD